MSVSGEPIAGLGLTYVSFSFKYSVIIIIMAIIAIICGEARFLRISETTQDILLPSYTMSLAKQLPQH